MRPYQLAAMFLLSTLTASADEPADDRVNMAIGGPGSDSFIFGTELWAISQIALRPHHGLSLGVVETSSDEDRLNLLRRADVEIALVADRPANADADSLRTIMVLWPDQDPATEMEPARLLARQDVSEDVVYRITKVVFDNPAFFKNTVETGLALIERDHAVTGAILPIHAGAARYYRENEPAFDAIPAAPRLHSEDSLDHPAALAPVHFANFDDAALNLEERSQVAAACAEALDIGTLSAVLGDLSSRGCEVYQEYMETHRSDRSPAKAALGDLKVHTLGQGGQAIVLRRGEDPTEIRISAPPRATKHKSHRAHQPLM